ncbi:hypothetical protein F8G81_10225 [Arthrobacter sp. CDRTa11]|nr:hypothetical protein F8G81_10225 [Arthrobacter sp. CDRTa11]
MSTASSAPSQPSLNALVRWMSTWVTEEGAINGFHNHSVWGTNPATFLDFTSGHAAFSAPALGALAKMLSVNPDPRAVALWKRMMHFQSHALQDDGSYRHVGFQVGESATIGLIHNATGSLGLLMGLRYGRSLLDDSEVDQILKTVLGNLEAMKTFGSGRPSEEGTCNQEYARVWVKLLYTELTGDPLYKEEIPEDLDTLISLHHHAGVPDPDSSGAFRTAADRTRGGILEPAEYYGLMIAPLVTAAQTYGLPGLLEEARRLALHIARSAWIDPEGMVRFHRYWYVSGDKVLKTDSPMLIAGMGLTLHGISELVRVAPDAELQSFIDQCLATYAHYQTPAGYFASATGWHNEADVAPSTAWHSHDLLFLAFHLGEDDPGIWDEVFAPFERQSVLTTDRAYWSEQGVHWCIKSPLTAGDLNIFGRKDQSTFTREFFAWTDKPPLPAELRYDEALTLFASNDGIYCTSGDDTKADITTLGQLPYRGCI